MATTRIRTVSMAVAALLVVLTFRLALAPSKSEGDRDPPERPETPPRAEASVTPDANANAGAQATRTENEAPAPTTAGETRDRADLAGRVTTLDGDPIAGATVRLSRLDGAGPENAQTRTDADGRFLARGLRPGTWRCVAGAPSFRLARTEIAIPREPLAIELPRDPGFLVRVLDENGTPVPGARIRLEGRTHGIAARRSGRAGADGTLRLSGFLPAGDGEWSSRLRVSMEGFRDGTAMLSRADAERGEIELTLDRGETLRVRVVDARGEPVRGARVSIHPEGEGSDSSRTLQTTTQGDVEFSRLARGTYSVVAVTRDRGFSRARHIRPGDPEEPLLISLPDESGTISGRVVEEAGKPALLCEVRLRPENDRDLRPACELIASADESGRFSFTGLPAGEYTLTLGGRRYDRVVVDAVTLDGGEERIHTVTQPGSIVGAIADECDVTGATVRVRGVRANGEPFDKTYRPSGLRGRLELARVPAGTYSVTLLAGGEEKGSASSVDVPSGGQSLPVEIRCSN